MSLTCRLCGEHQLKPKFEVNNCSIVQCTQCRFIQAKDQPSATELENIYNADYFDHGKYVQDSAIQREQQRRMQLLKNSGLQDGSTILDMGCATGDFISAAKKSYKVWGMDISSHAIETARQQNPEISQQLKIANSEQHEIPENHFDAIVLWDVIEHLWEPKAVLKQMKRWLKPNGFIFLSTPNIGAMTAKLMGKRWAFMTPPEHLCFFSRTSMEKIVQDLGFKKHIWKSQGKWVNIGFLFYKLNRVFPYLVPQSLVNFIRKRKISRWVIYIPTGDVQYISAQQIHTAG